MDLATVLNQLGAYVVMATCLSYTMYTIFRLFK